MSTISYTEMFFTNTLLYHLRILQHIKTNRYVTLPPFRYCLGSHTIASGKLWSTTFVARNPSFPPIFSRHKTITQKLSAAAGPSGRAV